MAEFEQKNDEQKIDNQNYHLPRNNNTYPLDPKLGNNPLSHLSRWDYLVKRDCIEQTCDFEKKYCFDKVMYEREGFKIVYLNKCNFVVKIFDTFGELNMFDKIFKEFIFIRETELIEYDAIYYNDQTNQVYITQPLYSKSLMHQINENNGFNDENIVRIIASDILNKIWIMNNCGYVHGDIEPDNIVKREFNDNNEYIDDGYKLIDFNFMKKYKSKGEYIGSIGWTAPEMVYGYNKNKYLYVSDIFSLGLVILFALFGSQPLQINDDDKKKYGQLTNFLNNQLNKEDMKQEKKFKDDLKDKMYQNHYNKLLKSENMLKNYLVKLYYDNKISLELFNLLHDGMLLYDPQKRWNCKMVNESKWFDPCRVIEKKKKIG
eukprot:28527_1